MRSQVKLFLSQAVQPGLALDWGVSLRDMELVLRWADDRWSVWMKRFLI
jgi:hypothetical protein